MEKSGLVNISFNYVTLQKMLRKPGNIFDLTLNNENE
jgi:hypothetical protein